jgi:RNA polymerase sigma-70 factor (ECF subfamily)
MAYNKAKEERKWRPWKEAEEKKLRSLGVIADLFSKQ